ncbi:SulP family inorganic anion transporter [Shewanella eurypsychrophilus]|uniref:SulP family inorganic anion transporter n=1 Tax=Shewanella eurypsychrophilus TaxID=2593656 RepID=A0ABX6V831_9GAMM|nr:MULTISPECIES: SulP family inorganic anion transporter [Shewanella]QFU22723.1 STAS domain-containing protein [Shewanella sp. YLB-09]QPG58012.1 SulP family inorganic anion transporter [Shewanella eurypsychrophilus]
MLSLSHFNRQSIKGDIFGALTSTIVALPFALAFGVTSGIGATAGIYCAIITGLFASIFGGTNQQISGPNTGLTVAMVAIVSSFVAQSPEHGLAAAFTVVSLAGVFQILFGFFKLGKYFILVSYPVISGFTSGIGVLIILSQIEPLFGSSLLDLNLSVNTFINTNTLVGLACLLVLFVWPRKFSHIVPASIIAVAGATIFYLVSASDIPVVGAIASELPSFHLPLWDSGLAGEMVKSALLIATLSTLDSLMTSLTVDSLNNDLHDSDQELVGQGIGNLVAGLFGALPGGGATMRTVTNLRAGGTTPLSGILHSLFILAIVLWAGEYTAYIPVAVLAAILMHVGISIIDWNFLKRIHKISLFSVVLMISTMVMAVVFDLVTAVLIGVFIDNLVTIRRLSELQLDNIKLYTAKEAEHLPFIERQIFTEIEDGVTLLTISGPIGFGVARGLKQCVSNADENKDLLIDLTNARFVGITSTIAIEEIILSYQDEGREVLLSSVCERVRSDFNKIKLLDKISADHVFTTRVDALVYLKYKRKNAVK